MKAFPSTPRLADAPSELSASGHLWLQENVDGAGFRFRMDESGVLVFGDRDRVFDADDTPTPFRHAVRHVRERFDRAALRAAVDDVEGHVFFGKAMHRQTIDYNWNRTPSFLGVDIWSADKEAFLPPDVVDQVFSRLGLEPINTFAQEVRARDFALNAADIPESNWYDGPAKGVIVRNKNGTRAKLVHPKFQKEDEMESPTVSVQELAQKYATGRRIETAVHELENREQPVTFDSVYERVLESIDREAHRQLYDDAATVDVQTFRSEVAALTRQHFDSDA